MKILYCDNHVLVVTKPAGLCVQNELDGQAKAYLKERYHKKGNVFLQPVHRIDRPVSGIVLFARTSKALSRLQKSFRDRHAKKQYSAIVEGELKQDGTLVHFLVHDSFKATLSCEEDKRAKRCQLAYAVSKNKCGFTSVIVSLETGRYHQIRAQFAAIGHPILGDMKYGSRQKMSGYPGIALHHLQFSIPHPVSSHHILCHDPEPACWDSFFPLDPGQ